MHNLTPYYGTIDVKFTDDAEYWGAGYGDPEAEPPCHCDIQKLAGSGHEAGCRWLQWNQNQKREERT